MMTKGSYNRKFLRFLGYLLFVHVLALLCFSLFRLVLFFATPYDFPEEVAYNYSLQSLAFLKGLWFDNVIACYILLPSLVLSLISSVQGRVYRWMYLASGIIFTLFYVLSFVISAANIPYFAYFFKIINSSVYNWFGYAGTTIGMVTGETSYRMPIVAGICVIALFLTLLWKATCRGLSKVPGKKGKAPKWNQRIVPTLISVAAVSLCVFGIRGRMGYNPIKVSQAYYCTDPFLNQLGVNPVFNLLTSTLDDCRKENHRLSLLDDDEAIHHVQAFLQRNGIEGISPIARSVTNSTSVDSIAGRPNVVIILMESMSASLMDTFGSTKGLTPCLDSLFCSSLSFRNFYSAGIHTNHGMYATLYSFPAIMKRNAMKGSVIPVYSGLPTVLKEHGWHNLFFMTHESQYDNMNAFYRTNGFDEIFAQENYPSSAVVNSFGVPDDFLFQYALPVLTDRASGDSPFFTVLLSVSNHPPYIIPKDFKGKGSTPEEQIVSYADASIRHFLDEAKKTSWYDNTIFVLLGDHGKLVGTPESELPESYNHIPLMIFGKGVTPGMVDGYAQQVDVAPTLLGLLGVDYIQNNYGVDLLKETRPCLFYTADNYIAARDSSHLFLYAPESNQTILYKIGADKKMKLVKESDASFDFMRKYTFSMLQSAEALVEKHQTLDHKENGSGNELKRKK